MEETKKEKAVPEEGQVSEQDLEKVAGGLLVPQTTLTTAIKIETFSADYLKISTDLNFEKI